MSRSLIIYWKIYIDVKRDAHWERFPFLIYRTARPTSFQFEIGLDEAGALKILWRSAFALAVDDRVERSSFGSKPNVSTGPPIDNVSAVTTIAPI